MGDWRDNINVNVATLAASGIVRNAGVLHRSAVALVDKLIDYVTASLTITDNGAGTGSLPQSTTLLACAIPGNRWGPCMVNSVIDSLASGAYGGSTGSYRFTMAQCVGAEWYDLFLSIDTAPKWVARVTEAQRATGGFEVTAVGTVAAGGGNPAGTIDVNLVGTGIQTSHAVFAQNNAYLPLGVTPVVCTGRKQAAIHVKLTVTDLRAQPVLSLVPFFSNQASPTDMHQGTLETMTLLYAVGQSLEQTFLVEVSGATGMVVLVDTISGQGATVSVWVELI